MAKSKARVALAVASKARRKEERQGIGKQRDQKVAPRTLIKYKLAMERLLEWVLILYDDLPSDAEDMDQLLCRWGEYCWEEGEPKGYYADALSATCFYLPRYKGEIPEAWSLLKVWNGLELPARAAPLHPQQLCALVGLSLHQGDVCLAACLMVAFQGLLRTCEFLGLRKKDIIFHPGNLSATLNLGLTKSGKRRGRPETLLLDDKVTLDLPCLAVGTLKAGEYVIGRTAPKFRKDFEELLKHLGLSGGDIKPYSLRRGGATHLFRETGNMSITAERGRWSSLQTARIYVDEAMAASNEAAMTVKQKALCAKYIRFYMISWHSMVVMDGLFIGLRP